MRNEEKFYSPFLIKMYIQLSEIEIATILYFFIKLIKLNA